MNAFMESTLKCDKVCDSNLFDNKNDAADEVENLLMALQTAPCCSCESLLILLLYHFSHIFHPEGHMFDDTTAPNKRTYEILTVYLFVCVFRIIPSSCSTMTVTRRWCPCGFAAAWRRDELRDMPDATAGRIRAWEIARQLQGELQLYALLQTQAQRSLGLETFFL